jgi:hypothetical protein
MVGVDVSTREWAGQVAVALRGEFGMADTASAAGGSRRVAVQGL